MEKDPSQIQDMFLQFPEIVTEIKKEMEGLYRETITEGADWYGLIFQ